MSTREAKKNDCRIKKIKLISSGEETKRLNHSDSYGFYSSLILFPLIFSSPCDIFLRPSVISPMVFCIPYRVFCPCLVSFVFFYRLRSISYAVFSRILYCYLLYGFVYVCIPIGIGCAVPRHGIKIFGLSTYIFPRHYFIPYRNDVYPARLFHRQSIS